MNLEKFRERLQDGANGQKILRASVAEIVRARTRIGEVGWSRAEAHRELDGGVVIAIFGRVCVATDDFEGFMAASMAIQQEFLDKEMEAFAAIFEPDGD